MNARRATLDFHYAYWSEYCGYQFSISPESFSALPIWSQDEAHPPLSPRLAIANSQLVVNRLLRDVQPFDPKFSACSLKTRNEYGKDWWYYVVSWFVPEQDLAADWSEFSVPVLFDGSTPEPKKFRYEDRVEVYRRSSSAMSRS